MSPRIWIAALCLVSIAKAEPPLARRVVEDQAWLFGSPFRVHKRDLIWAIPAGALTGLLIASDHHAMSAHVHSTASTISLSNTVSNVSLAALAVVPAGLYGLGFLHYDHRLEEGASLAGEAAVDSLVAAGALKLAFRREQPSANGVGGAFFQSSLTGGSFPSTHAMLSWSIASAVAHRYPGWLTETLVYSLAAAASVPRITAEKHFPADVFVGGLLGWLIGRGVFERRHIDWNPVVEPVKVAHPRPVQREGGGGSSGPVLVPMDSWIYPVLARLGALGYISRQAAGMRPWTRTECMRQLGEAEEALAYGHHRNSEEALRLVSQLREEFERDRGPTQFLELDSVCGRWLGISGTPLVDGYNFGQTVINDYGRPYGAGSNIDAGFSADAVDGRASFYIRGEFQHAAPFSSPALELKPTVHQLEPVLTAEPNGVNRFEPLEMYAGVQVGGWSLTVGKQELWWGPGEAGPLSFSTDAEPFYSFRFTSAAPIFLPGFLRHLGAFRADFIGGELSGHHLPPRPLLNGQKLTWNVTNSIELGFTRWSLFDGAGTHAFNAASVIRNLFANGATFGNAVDPGDRKSGFDFRWRLPRSAATLYSDFYADDEPSPLTSPRRSGFSPGLYLPRLPGFAKWDLRIEAPSTRLAIADQGGFFLYWNSVYNDANTNRGNLLGSWAGRDGRGLLVSSTYWHSARSRLEFAYRQNRIGPAFLPGGGTQTDASVRASILLRPDWSVVCSTQYERYDIPVLGPRQRDLLASVQLTYEPHWRPFQNGAAGFTKR